MYRERDETLRATFVQTVLSYARERFVYMDQTGFDNTLQSAWGYCHRSQRLISEVLGHRTERVSVISAGWGGEVIAPMVFEGYTTSQLVCQWIEEWLLPEMLPGQILVLDNASFHPPERIRELLARAGCEVLFLSPYSPDLNKIEQFWARLKHQVEKVLDLLHSFFIRARGLLIGTPVSS